MWQVNAEIQAAQKTLIAQLVPALLFLLMVTCDLRAICALGPRVLAVFACAMASILVAFVDRVPVVSRRFAAATAGRRWRRSAQTGPAAPPT